MHRARTLAIIASLAAPALLITTAGCQSTQNATESRPMIDQLVGDWNLTSLQGTPLTLPQGARQPTLSFTPDGKVSGTGGVNRLASSIDLPSLAKGQFKLAPAASTKMAGPPEAMALEDTFYRLLGEATGLSIDADTLSLTNTGGELLKFVRIN